MVIGLFFGWAIWMNADRSETLVWESLEETNLFGIDNTQTGTEEKSGVPEQETPERPATFHPEQEETLTRSSEAIVTPPVKQEAVSETIPQSFQLQRKP
jgi:hypothetical protein